jgi:hypothetical protein
MLSKCSNPGCSARFLYLHTGKVFKLNGDPTAAPNGSGTRRREYFWLCEECALNRTLVFRPGLGVITIARERQVQAAAAAAAD